MTVGVPVFNGEKYLGETLDSILAQDFADFELLVSDNASTDGTVRLVEDYARRDPRVRMISNDYNRGAAYNYNRLVHEADGELFKWAGYDDLLSASYLRRCVAALDADPAAVLAYPGTTIIDADGAHVVDYKDRLHLADSQAWLRVARFAHRVNLCNACFGVMRRDVMLGTGLIRPYVSSDLPFLAEMASRGKFLEVPERLFHRRVHDGSSRQGRTSLAQVAQWFDSSAVGAPRAPRWQIFAGTVGALSRTPSSLRERSLIIFAYVTVWGLRRTRVRLGRLRASLLGRSLARPELIYRTREHVNVHGA